MLKAFTIVAALAVGAISCAALLGFDPAAAMGPDPPAGLGGQVLRGAGAGIPAPAVALYATALERDPASPRRWTDLGNALYSEGDPTGAEACFTRALQLGPRIPEVLLRVAEFDFAQSRPTEAFAAASRLVSLDPSFEEPGVEWDDGPRLPVIEVLETGIPEKRIAQSYFEHMRKAGSAAEVAAAWQWLTARSWATPLLARGYVETELQTGEFEGAVTGSSIFLKPLDPGFLNPSLVFNGGFEVPPDGSPLAWTVFPFEGISVERDTSTAHSGAASLHLHFGNAGNALFGHVFERLYPRPGRWRARAFVRTVDLTSSEGIRLLISDSELPARLYVQTPAVAGTHDWTLVETTFAVTPATHELKLQIFRPQSAGKDGAIYGDAWIDDVSVVPE
jgi:tetratricopeptide (TPR) repeat protein